MTRPTHPVPIADPADPRIAPYTAIRERDLTGRGDRFIVEGRVTLGILLTKSHFAPESLFLAESRLEPLAPLLARVPAEVPVYTAPAALMAEIAGFPVHRGVLACARKGPPLTAAALLEDAPSPLLLAIGLSNHDNVGALFRNAAAFGAGGVLLDGESCDPLYRKAIRVSAGTALWLPFAQGGTGAGLLAALKAGGYQIWALTPRSEAVALQDMPIRDPIALMVGAEGPGLPDALIEAATPVRIPMASDVDSLNVATAAAIALAHLFYNQAPRK